MQHRGHDVHVISFHPKPIPGVNVHYVGRANQVGELPKRHYLWAVPRVRRLLRCIRPDVVMATYYRSNGLVGALTKCSPLIISARGIDWDFALPLGLGNRLTRWIASRAELLHASSPELVDQLVSTGIARERFTVIPLGTDPDRFRPRQGPRSPGPVRILCTRKHHAVYDNPTILRALARLRDARMDFIARFVGTGSQVLQNQRLAADLGLAEHVEFLGDAEHNEIPGHLSWADVYVSAAHSDGAPSSLFEAMSCGLYPVVTDVRANQAYLRHLVNAFLFAPGDDAACAAGLRYVWEHHDMLSEAGLHNRAIVKEHCDRNINLGRLEVLLAKAAAMRTT
jgi:glycosyltransferase involved in cell wall biosynthesis